MDLLVPCLIFWQPKHEELGALATAIGEAARRLDQTQSLPGRPESSMGYEKVYIHNLFQNNAIYYNA